tara:strand:+ start:1573 stop:1863 length:291 start_codon:yes stop_codon:yes gene_type:complete
MTDWQKGDLALCVEHFEENATQHGLSMPSKGAVYNVAEVFDHPLGRPWGAVGLRFSNLADKGPKSAWNSNMFRKVTPPKDMTLDAEELGKPVQVSA